MRSSGRITGREPSIPSTGSSKVSKAESALRAYALSLPESYEEFPWGHRAIKVKGKAFVFMGYDDGRFGISTKLPSSRYVALDLPFSKPTAYGLGKSGWVSAQFGPKDRVPVPILRMWIEESYRAVAPKRLVKTLGEG